MLGIDKIRRADPDLAEKIKRRGGFLTDDDLDALEKIDRLMLVLVRCGNGRMLCAVQNVRHFTNIIKEHAKLKSEKTGEPEVMVGDYVRDISLPGG